MALASARVSQAGPPISVDIDATGPIAGASITGGPDLPFCQSAKLLAEDGVRFGHFGSVSVSGDVALVGAYGYGAAYVFRWNGTAWVQEQKLLANNGTDHDSFGVSVSVSGDVALVGAPGDDDNGSASGAAYVFRWNGTAWVQEQKLVSDDGAAGDYFGRSVSVSGEVALVGAPWDDDNGRQSGSAYVFRWNGTAWVQEQKLLPNDGAVDDRFGSSVSVSGDMALVGAPRNSDNGLSSGSAYAFRWNGTAWVQEQKLLADNGAAGDDFGNSVSVSDDVALVGAHGVDDNGSASGAAYVFRWNGTAWVQEQKLLPNDGASGDLFGLSVSVSGDVALVGASRDSENGRDSGSVYVFRWNGALWVEKTKLLPDDGAADDGFGASVSVSGDVALVGALDDDDQDSGMDSGSAYVFSSGGPDCNLNGAPDRCDIANGTSTDSDGNGVPDICTDFCELAPLQADDGAGGDEFGSSVSVSGDVALVGARLDGDNGPVSGSAYVFRWNGTAWVQEQKLVAEDGMSGAVFGSSVSVSGDVALAGAPGRNSGSAYVFRWNGSAWVQEQKLLADDGAAGDNFGVSVSISDGVALVGADLDDDNGSASGSAHVFRWNGSTWVEEQKLVPDDGVAGDRFGSSVSVSGDVALVGAHGVDDNGSASGAAYVFRWNGIAWVQKQKLRPDDVVADNRFGASVSVSGDVSLVGAYLDDDNDTASGAAYVFRWKGIAWIQEQKLLPNDGTYGDQFGSSVSIFRDVALVGARRDGDNGMDSGSAYVFRWNGTAWVQAQKLLPYDGAPTDYFGQSVSISGDHPLVGAHHDINSRMQSGSARVFTIGVTDCNENDVFDACDIGTGSSGDCNDNQVPDDCEVPQTGAVASEWVGENGLWDDPPDNRTWCLPEAPNNNPDATFDATITSPSAVVTINTSPTIVFLSLLDGAAVQVDDDSGANVRTLAVDETITNSGVIRATDRERLVIDVPVIDQGGVCGEGGILEATDGVLGAGEDNDKSILEINGARVLGGVAQTIGVNSEIHLIGGAELVDVCIDGVVVPDGQTGAFSGTLDNSDVLTVRGITADTRLGPATINAILDSTTGTGSVRLTSQAHARLGDFKTSFKNAKGHRIEGAGIIFGGLTNKGLVEANSLDGALILFPPGAKTNHGCLRAVDGGTLRIEDTLVQEGALAVVEAVDGGIVAINSDITGDGTLRADNGTVAVNSVSVAFRQVDVEQAGRLQVDGNAHVDVSGAVTMSSGGVYQATDSPNGVVAASLSAASVSVECSSKLLLSQAMSLASTGNLELLGFVPLHRAVRGGCDPPGYKATGSSSVEVGGDFLLNDFAAAEHTSTEPLILHGAFDIRSTSAQFFSWDSGAIRLASGDDATPSTTPPLQTFEVAGVDRGPDISGFNNNFAVDSIEIAAGSSIAFVNATSNAASAMACSEALYVHTLAFRADSQVTLNDCRVYYLFIQNDGVSPTFEGCGELVLIPSGDADGNRVVDLADYRELMGCLMGPGLGPIKEPCGTFDFDFDQDVDLIDFAAFQRQFMLPMR